MLHGLPEFGLGALTHWVEHTAEVAAHAVPAASGFVEWLVNAALGGIFGLALGLVTIPVAKYLVNPAISAVMKLFGRGAGAAAQ